MPPEDPTLALLATVVVDLLGLTELFVELPKGLLAVEVMLDVADLLTELETADVVVLLKELKVAVFEAVVVAALAAACC